MNLIPFPNADGGFVFTCTGCGYRVHTAVHDGVPVCSVCRWLDDRPQIPKEVRDRIRRVANETAEKIREARTPVTRDSNGQNGCGNG